MAVERPRDDDTQAAPPVELGELLKRPPTRRELILLSIMDAIRTGDPKLKIPLLPSTDDGQNSETPKLTIVPPTTETNKPQ
jgi:hypothetical protein